MSGHIGVGFYDAYNPKTMAEVGQASWGADLMALDKLASDGTAGITTSGAFNAIYGPKLFNLAYNRMNSLACLGVKPYFTGIRFQEDLSSIDANSARVGAGVIRGAYRRAPQIAKYNTVEEPFKVNEWNFAMEFGMAKINGVDDVLKWEQQMELEGKTWMNAMNQDLLRKNLTKPFVGIGQYPAGDATTITSTERVGLEALDVIISNNAEADCVPGNNTAWTNGGSDKAGPAVLPWYGSTLPSSAGNALAKYRDRDASGFSASATSNYDSYVDSNYTANTTVGASTDRQLNLSMIDNLFNNVMPWWEDNKTGGKVLLTGYDTQTKLQAILQPQQRYQDATFAQVSVNGISSVEGRGVGFQVASYNGVPIIPDLNMCKDTISRIFLVDTNNLGRGVLQTSVINVSENPLITGVYQRVCNMYDLSEIQATAFRTSGKIIHLK